MLYIFAAGFIGGLIRGLVGVTKYITATPSRAKKVNKEWLVLSLAASGGLGLIVGCFITDDVRFALLAGYAGTDFMENLYKIKMKKRNWD